MLLATSLPWGRCTIVGVVGNDKAADTIRELLETDDRILPRLVVAKDRPTSEKTRFVTNGQHLLRVDSEVSVDIDEGTENEIFNVIDGFMGNHDVLILSDYAKGVLTKGVLTRIISGAGQKRTGHRRSQVQGFFSLQWINPFDAELYRDAGRDRY